MSDLKGIDKIKFEKLFGMSSGYVLDFSDRTMALFVHDSVGLHIHDEKYQTNFDDFKKYST